MSLLLLELARARFLQILFDSLEATFGDAEISEQQLVFHRLRVTRGIHRSRRVRHRLVAKRAHDVHQRVSVLVRGNVNECLRTRARRRDQIGEFDGRGNAFARVVHRREDVEARVRHFEMPIATSPLPRGASFALVIN